MSSNGRAWACGHGQGGRLGLDSEKTVLKPQQIKTGGEVVISAAVGTNHTLLLMESGVVSTILNYNTSTSSLAMDLWFFTLFASFNMSLVYNYS